MLFYCDCIASSFDHSSYKIVDFSKFKLVMLQNFSIPHHNNGSVLLDRAVFLSLGLITNLNFSTPHQSIINEFSGQIK